MADEDGVARWSGGLAEEFPTGSNPQRTILQNKLLTVLPANDALHLARVRFCLQDVCISRFVL